MKKLLLIACAVFISVGLYAQKVPAKTKMNIPTSSALLYNIAEDVPAQSPSLVSTQPVNQNSNRGTSVITVINIGTSANAYGLYNGGRTALWADPNINSVAFFHRMALSPGSGFIAHDLSTNGGTAWTVNNQIYAPVGDAVGRYPQGVLVNPVGNTNPNNAHAVSLSPILDGSNAGSGSWGGLGATISNLDGSGVAQQQWPTTGPFRNNVPDGMTVNPITGDVFVVDASMITGLNNQYVDTLIITRGVVDGGAISWEQSLLYAPVNQYGTMVIDPKIAFAPNGLIGYICTLSDNGEDNHATGSAYYPILYKTTDGGLTFSEDAITVPLSGADGLSGIINGLLTDDQIAELFEAPLPYRDEILYTTAYTYDFAVDMNGNPVISVVIGVASSNTPYSIISGSGFFASYNIFSNDGGVTWIAQKLGENLKNFRGTFGEISEDNRSQLTTTFDGTKMFFSWLDTDFDGIEDNTKPDIFCIGWDVETNKYTDVVNVTFLSDAWLQAYMGTASYYALTSGSDYIIPFVYQEMQRVNNVADPTVPVQYKYIPDFSFSPEDFHNANEPLYHLTLNANPSNAATLRGAGNYGVGASVAIRVNSVNPGFQFLNWTNSLGNIVSEEISFDYVMSAENVSFQANFISCEHGWVPVPNLQFNMQVLAQIMIDDAVSTNTTDVLGAFVGDECRGIASHIEGLGMAFLSVGSNQGSGEVVELKIWNSTLCEYCDAGPGFTFVNLGEVGTFDNPLQVSCITDVDLNFNFGQGYTWFSQNLALENPHPNAFFEGLVVCNNDRLISQSGFNVYYNGSWNGTIAALNPSYSYRLKICAAKAFTASAPPAEIVPIALNSGYTWMGYLPQTCLPVNVALANMNPAPAANDRLIGQGSFALYNGSQWMGSLTTLCPGVGYVIKLANSATLVYPAASAKAKTSNSFEAELSSPTDIKPAKNLQHSMTVLGQLELPGGQYSYNADDRIYAFANGQCVGMANPMGAENGLIFLSVGENSDEAQQVSFKIWLDAEKQLYEANETLAFAPLKGTGVYENPFKFTLGQPVNSENDWFIGEPYPNPFNEETVVPYKLKEAATIVVKIYNSSGQLVREIKQFNGQAGSHHFHLPKEQLKSGLFKVVFLIRNEQQYIHATKTVVVI